MALLGTSTNMRCNGYFPGYHSPRDIVIGAEGSPWTSSNGNSELKNDCYQISTLPLSSNCHLFGYNKELLKQTILKHEAIFRDQIHELHRVYQKQRELMEEIKRNELRKHNLRLETSWSGSSLYYSQSLPQLTGPSSTLITESFQLPLPSVQEKNRQLFSTSAYPPAPVAIKESSEDPKQSDSTFRKVGKKILDLQLPADEYIDSEGESFENERVIKEPPLLTNTVNGISQVMGGTDQKPYGSNSNGFADLNLPFKLEEAGAKSDSLGGYYTFHDRSGRMTLGFHSLPNDVIQNPNRKRHLEACTDDPQLNQGKKHGRLSLGNTAGQHDDGLGSPAKFNDTELLGQSTSSCTSALCQLVSERAMTSSGISAAVLRKSITPGSSLDFQSYIMNRNFHSGSMLLSLPSVRADDINCCDKRGSSSASHEFGMYVKGSEHAGTYKNINLNVMPAGYSCMTAFQRMQSRGEDKFLDSRLPWFKEKLVGKEKPIDESKTSAPAEYFLLKPCSSGCVHSDSRLNNVEKSDSTREKILAFDLNGNPKVCDSLSKKQWVEEVEDTSDVNSPCNHDPDIGEQIPACEQFRENEKKKHEHLAGVIDLNSFMDEDEPMSINTDLQAPVSPENKECSPPRGESDENQLEIPLQLVGQEDLEAQDEHATYAAEALVSISGVIAKNDLQMTNCPSSEYVSSPLHWFAGIISTIVDHSKSEVTVDFSGTIRDLEDILPADFDYFEFMSLNLSETKDHDCCYKSSDQNEQGGSTSPTQPRNCRTSRGRRGKDFQSEILPSLASLSRCEVTEDLQTIGGLVETAKIHSATGYKRSAGKNVLSRGKRRSLTSASTITDLLNLKQLNSNTESGIQKRGLISWGKICRKRRGQRFPTTKPQFLLSQVHN